MINIPKQILDIYESNYPSLVDKDTSIPREFLSRTTGGMPERYISNDIKLDNSSYIYLIEKKNPEFVLKNFVSGNPENY